MHITKKVIAAGIIGIALMSGTAQAMTSNLDGSSLQAMQKSAKEMTANLSEEKKHQFAAAVSVISIKETQLYFADGDRDVPKKPSDISQKDRENLTERALSLLDGMTAAEIIALASGEDYAEARQMFGELQQKLHGELKR